MGFWDNLEGYFDHLRKTELFTEPWALLSIKEKKLNQVPIPQPEVTIPDCIENALVKERAPIPEVCNIITQNF